MRKLTAAWMIPLLLLPNFLFLLPLAAASAASPVQPSAQPLPPGAISYHNSWNETLVCPATAAATQPLVPAPSGWTASLNVPTYLFHDQPTGSLITQRFIVSPLGAFSVSDSSGNSLSLSVPTSQFSGAVSTRLVANTTMAVQSSVFSSGTFPSANITLVFSVYKEFCQPAGVRLEILGNADWGTTGKGVIPLRFASVPLSVGGDRAWFGNRSGTALGFDWSDSASLGPSYSSGTISWTVGPSFKIDPVTVGTTTSAVGTEFSFQNHVCVTIAKDFEFYFDGTSYGFRSSNDTFTWGPETTISTSGVSAAGMMGIACSGNTVYRAIVGTSSGSTTGWYFDSGTLNPRGTITWAAETHVETSDVIASTVGPSLAVSSTGVLWISLYSTTHSRVELWKCAGTCGTASNWSDNHDISGVQCGVVVSLTEGKMSFVFEGVSCTGEGTNAYSLSIQTYDGSSTWSTSSTATGSYRLSIGSAISSGTTTQVCVGKGQGQRPTPYFLSFTYGGSWSSGTNVAGSGQSGCSITSPSVGTLYAFWADGTSVQYKISADGGSTWGSAITISSDSSSFWFGSLSASGMVMSTWITGTGPYNIRFYALPLIVPTAASSNNPWSRPGVSPYEDYFSEFSDYLSPGNGLLTLTFGTLDVPSRGMPLSVGLVYSQPYAFRSSGSPYKYDNYTNGVNPAGPGSTIFGYGWGLNLPWIGPNYLHLFNGEAIPYNFSGNTMTYHGAEDFSLVYTAGTSYVLTMKSGTVYTFQYDTYTAQYLLASITEDNGNRISISYTPGTSIAIADATGQTATLNWGSVGGYGRIVSASYGGKSWSLGYSGPTALTSITDPLGRVTNFGYAGTSGAKQWIVNSTTFPTRGKITFSFASAPVGTEITTYYATSRNVYYSPTGVSESQSMYYSIFNGQVTWANTTTSGAGGVVSHTNINFQPSKNVQKVYSKDGTGALQNIAETDSDRNGRTNETRMFSPSGSQLYYTVSNYDSWGNVKYHRDAPGQQTWSSYANTDSSNSFGTSGCSTSFYTQFISSAIHDRLVGTCDYQNGPGTTQEQAYYKYDSNGNLLEQKVRHNGVWLYTDHTYDTTGNLLSTTDANNHVTYFRYSPTYGSAYLTKQSTLAGTQNITTTYTYNSTWGWVLSKTDPNHQTTSYKYDVLGRQTQVTYPTVLGVRATTNSSYDDTNSIMTTTDPDGHVAKQYFDGLARLTEVARLNGSSPYSTEYYTYNWADAVATKTTAANHIYNYTYDWSGRLVRLTNPDTTCETTSYNLTANTKTVTDENGHQIVYYYDWGQHLVHVREYNSTNSYYLTTYSYDYSGNLLSVIDAHSPTQTTTYTYDDLNRLNKTTFPDSKTEAKTYDSAGNLLTRTTANGSTISFTYDSTNRLTKVTYPGTGGTVTYTYDADGNKLSMVNPSVIDNYTYDARDRLSSQTEKVGGTSYQTQYSYDRASNVIQITYPDSYNLAMTYDGINRLKIVGGFATIGYTVDDKISQIVYGNGEVATYTYDSRDRPTQIMDKYQGVKKIDLNYTYDGTGNVKSINTETYRYDWLNRLNYTSGPWGTITYTYDQVGNRLKMVQGSKTTLYAYATFNRLSSAGGTTYTYDANGNMIARNTTAWKYSYDYENRLAKVVHSSTIQTNYYDGSGDRVQQVEGSSTFTYSYQRLNILYEKNVTGGTTAISKHFYAGGLQVAKMVDTTMYYLHQDALGSTRLETTSTVTTKFSSNYVPFGQNYAISGKEVFMYTGKPYDSATGLYYYGARYYDPSVGRFVTQDSYGGSQTDPMSLNRYIYARDNPEKYVDPTGHVAASYRSYTDFDDPYVTQTSNCVNGVCTITDTESYGGYTSSISTTMGTYISGGTAIAWGGTTITDTNPGGNTRTSTTYSQSTYEVAPPAATVGQEGCSVSTFGINNPGQRFVLGSLLFIAGFALTAAAATSAPPSIIVMGGGVIIPNPHGSGIPDAPPGVGPYWADPIAWMVIGGSMIFSSTGQVSCETQSP